MQSTKPVFTDGEHNMPFNDDSDLDALDDNDIEVAMSAEPAAWAKNKAAAKAADDRGSTGNSGDGRRASFNEAVEQVTIIEPLSASSKGNSLAASPLDGGALGSSLEASPADNKPSSSSKKASVATTPTSRKSGTGLTPKRKSLVRSSTLGAKEMGSSSKSGADDEASGRGASAKSSL